MHCVVWCSAQEVLKGSLSLAVCGLQSVQVIVVTSEEDCASEVNLDSDFDFALDVICAALSMREAQRHLVVEFALAQTRKLFAKENEVEQHTFRFRRILATLNCENLTDIAVEHSGCFA